MIVFKTPLIKLPRIYRWRNILGILLVKMRILSLSCQAIQNTKGQQLLSIAYQKKSTHQHRAKLC